MLMPHLRKFFGKILGAILLVGLALGAAMPTARAQTPTQTLAELLEAAAAANPAEFTTLVAALKSTDLLGILAEPSNEATLFAPTDAAFEAYKAEIGEEAFNALLADPETLANLLLNHVVSFPIDAERVIFYRDIGSPASVKNVIEYYLHFQRVEADGRAETFVEGGWLQMPGQPAINGFLYPTERVLAPEMRTIGEIITARASAEQPEYTFMQQVLEGADPELVAQLNDPNQYLTLIAPTDAAFEAYKAEIGAAAFEALFKDTAKLTELLRYHILPNKFGSEDVVQLLEDAAQSNPQPTALLETLSGKSIEIAPGEEGKSGAYINGMMIAEYDINSINGIIQATQGVLQPEQLNR
jgi:transforming growth factor-beta-induced protein